MRINKFLGETGLVSRRGADRWIEDGRVTINGQPASLGSQVEAGDDVRVDGRPAVLPAEEPLYIALNKPVGITSTTDRQIEGNIVDFIGHKQRLFHVGRLDKDSDGLILMTNDGDIVNEILREEHGHEKEYVVTVEEPITEEFLEAMRAGVRILGTKTKPCRVEQLESRRFRIVLTQGLNRQIRRMCSALGYTVRRLQRVRVLNIQLDGLAIGEWRELGGEEKRELFRLLGYRPKR